MVRKSLFLILALAGFVSADTGFPSTIKVTETDNSPSCVAGQIKFGPGQVSCSGQTATVTITGGSGGSSSLAVTAGVSRSSPTSDLMFNPNQFSGSVSGSSITISLISGAGMAPNATYYIRNTETLQSGATFYVSSGTVSGDLTLLSTTSAQTLTFTNSRLPNNGGIGPQTVNTFLFNKQILSSTTGALRLISSTMPYTGSLSGAPSSGGYNYVGIQSPNSSVSGSIELYVTSNSVVSPVGMYIDETGTHINNISSGQCVQTGTNGLLTGTGSACGAGGGMTAGATYYIQVRDTLQTGATFYVSSGTIQNQLTVGDGTRDGLITYPFGTDTYTVLGSSVAGTEGLCAVASSSRTIRWQTCGTGTGGGGGSGTINAADQFSLPYYSLAGSTTQLSGYPNVTLSTTTGITISTGTTFASSITITNASNLNLNSGVGILNAQGVQTSTLQITGLTSKSCIGTDGSGNVQAGTCGGGGGASSLAVTVGVNRSSPTSDVMFNPSQFYGDISGSSITIKLTGNLSLSSFTATQPVLYDNTNGAFSLTKVSLSTGVVGTLPVGNGGTGLTSAQSATQPILYNSATGVFSATPISLSTGATGTLQAAQEPAHTGDVTNTAGSLALTIANSAVTLAKMENRATQTFIGRNTAGTGVPEELSAATAKTMLNLSGTNTGDQTITLSGDSTGSGTAGITVTAAANQANITTLSASSVTVTGNLVVVGSETIRGSGLSVPFGVTVSSGLFLTSATVNGQFVAGGITDNELSASQFVVSDANKKLASSLNGASLTSLTGANIATVIPSSVLPSTVAYYNSTGTWTALQTFTRVVKISSSVHDSSDTPGTNGQVLTSGGPGTVPTWTTPTGGSGYATVQDEGSGLTQRTTLNFTGTGVSCADNAGSSRTDCTINSGAATAGGNSGNVQFNQGGSIVGASGFNIWDSSITLSTGTYKVYSSTFQIDGGSLSVNSGNIAFNNVSSATLNAQIDFQKEITVAGGNHGYNDQILQSSGSAVAPKWGPIVALVRSTSTFTSAATTTPSDIPNMEYDLIANATYQFTCNIVFQTTATVLGARLSQSLTAGSTIAATIEIPTAADGTGGALQGWVTMSGDSVTGTAVQAANTNYIGNIKGAIFVGSSGATTSPQVGGEVTNGSTKAMAGSICIYTGYLP